MIKFLVIFSLSLFVINLFVEYLNIQQGNDCMFRYVVSPQFGFSTGYIQKLFGIYNHISYDVDGKVIGSCVGCDCSDFMSSYQCFNNLLFSKFMRG